MRALCCFTATLLFATPAAHAVNWFGLEALSKASNLEIDVDTDSLRQSGTRREIRVRVTYPETRLHRWGASFRSVAATVEFECEGRLAGYRDAVFYAEPAGRGLVMAKEDGPLAPIPDRTADLLPSKSVEQLVRAACAQPKPAAR